MLRTTARRLRPLLITAAGLLASQALTAQQGGQANPPPAPALGEAATQTLCARYAQTDHWVQQAIILLSLNHWWHPAGSSMILDALQSRNERLLAFGIEALLRSEEGLLPTVASRELLDELISRQLDHRNDYYRERVTTALKRLAPGVDAQSKGEWRSWWRDARPTFESAAWQAKQQSETGGSTQAAAQRAFDLYEDGLELMVCIDSTGSMQPTIDALSAALGDMADALDGISPKLRLGVVQYKDYAELGKSGAKVVQPLKKNIKAARKSIDKLQAYGGGDLPEAVLSGLTIAFDRKMKWRLEANKLVILIGDAPPHEGEVDGVLELVRRMHQSPRNQPGKPVTGKKESDKPFLTSCIGVFIEIVRGANPPGWDKFLESQEHMRSDFTAIAAAGGGVFVELVFEADLEPVSGDDEERIEKDRAKDRATADRATRQIVEHILVLSFGEQFRNEMRDFVRILYAHKDGGLIR